MSTTTGLSSAKWPLSALILLLISGVASAAAAPDDPSPATGHAAVIAQGVAELPQTALAWRLDTPPAEPEAAASSTWATGFALATRGAILLTGKEGEEARLAPGEAAFVHDGDSVAAQSLTGRRVRFARIELIPTDEIADDDRADFVSEPFDAPAGRRDLDLVRDVLGDGESTELPASDAPILVYATAGDLRIRGDDVTETIAAGDAAAVTGPVTLVAAGGEEAAFVAAVVGPDVAAPAEPTPDPGLTGSIQIRFFGCGPEAIGQTEIDAELCEPLLEGVDATITGEESGTTLTLADTAFGGGLFISFEWSGLPLDTYVLSDVVVPPGYDGVVVDSMVQSVALTADAPDGVFVIFAVETDG